MWHVYELANGVKKQVATTWSESMAWLLCKERNSMAKMALGIRYDYERAL